MADRHQIFAAHLGIPRHVIRITIDIIDQLSSTSARAAAGTAARYRPGALRKQRRQGELAGIDLVDEVGTGVIQQDHAGDRHRQLGHQAFADPAHQRVEVVALQGLAGDTHEDAIEDGAARDRVPSFPRDGSALSGLLVCRTLAHASSPPPQSTPGRAAFVAAGAGSVAIPFHPAPA